MIVDWMPGIFKIGFLSFVFKSQFFGQNRFHSKQHKLPTIIFKIIALSYILYKVGKDQKESHYIYIYVNLF